MTTHQSLRAFARAFALSASLLGCGDDFEPTVSDVAGTYHATRFILVAGGVTTNLLDEGAELTITLATDGTTTGRLFIPGGGEHGGDLDADLAGAWTLTGATVTFDQEADTFMRDVEFTASKDRLTAEAVDGDETLRLTLER